MSEGKVFPPGTFCWVELGTSDAASARGFYSDLLGWDTNAVEMGELGTYILLQLIMPPSDIPDLGRFSILTDPQGAAFAMIKLNAAETN